MRLTQLPILPIHQNFLVSTMGINPNGTNCINNFDLTKNVNYPTFRDLISESIKLHPEQRNVSVLGITEMSEIDFNKFSSEQ